MLSLLPVARNDQAHTRLQSIQNPATHLISTAYKYGQRESSAICHQVKKYRTDSYSSKQYFFGHNYHCIHQCNCTNPHATVPDCSHQTQRRNHGKSIGIQIYSRRQGASADRPHTQKPIRGIPREDKNFPQVNPRWRHRAPTTATFQSKRARTDEIELYSRAREEEEEVPPRPRRGEEFMGKRNAGRSGPVNTADN